MPRVVVRYRTKPDQADENERLVAAVYAELAATKPAGLRYFTLRLADNTFVHIADVDEGVNALNQTAAFAEFLAGVGDRCEPGEGPNPQPATLVGSYGLDA